MRASLTRDLLIVVSAAAKRGRTAGAVIFARRMDSGSEGNPSRFDAADLRVLGGAEICVFPIAAVFCLILLCGHEERAVRVRL
ncbi:hypothetical protein ASG57_20745 [Bradyrhizobium sp. Leaf396]|nr:hypothetical protein ASG57_20745 [Bradyrhizobium sp. Leaf396]